MAYKNSVDLPDRRTTVYRGRGVKVEFQMNRAGIRKIALGHELLAACRSVVVQRALPFAIQNSPRGRVNDGSGELPYVASWRVKEGTAFLVGMERVAVKLINVSPHAAAVEFINPKTGRGHGYGVLARTLAHLHGAGAASVAAARSAPRKRGGFQPEQHPRGARGRFVSKSSEAAQRAQDEAAARRRAAERQVADAIFDDLRRRRLGRSS